MASLRSTKAIILKSSKNKSPNQWMKTVNHLNIQKMIRCTVKRVWTIGEGPDLTLPNLLREEGALVEDLWAEVVPAHIVVDKAQEEEEVWVLEAKVMLNSHKSTSLVSLVALSKKILKRFLRSVVKSEVSWWSETTRLLTSSTMVMQKKQSSCIMEETTSAIVSSLNNLVSAFKRPNSSLV